MLTGKFFLHEHFVPPPEVASLSQQGRIGAAQRACEVFSISIMLVEAHLDCKCTGEVIPFRSHYLSEELPHVAWVFNTKCTKAT